MKSDLLSLADRVTRLEQMYKNLLSSTVNLCLDESMLADLEERTSTIKLEFDDIKSKLSELKKSEAKEKQVSNCAIMDKECGDENKER